MGLESFCTLCTKLFSQCYSWWDMTGVCYGWWEIFKNVFSTLKYYNISVYWVLYWEFPLYFKINKKISLLKQIFWFYMQLMHLSIICMKQVCEWYDFVFPENVTSRAWVYLFRSEFIKWDSIHSDLFLKFEFNS